MQIEISTCYENLKAVFVQETNQLPEKKQQDSLNFMSRHSNASVGLSSKLSPQCSTVMDSNLTTPYSQYYYQSPVTSGKPSMDKKTNVISSGAGGKSFTLKAHGE